MDKTKIYLNLSKCRNGEQQTKAISLLPKQKHSNQYQITNAHTILSLDEKNNEWWVFGARPLSGKTELTYPEFIKLFEGGEEETSLQIALKALENIINPIGYMKSQLEEGDTFNGYAAVMIAEKPQFYQNIAKEALEKINSNQ